jgi:SAM-dependent methyltransferase
VNEVHAQSTTGWSNYAEVYDLMAENNPAYLEIIELVLAKFASFSLCGNDRVVELGAGTGNFTAALAANFPRCQFVHLDDDDSMNRKATQKMKLKDLGNLLIECESSVAASFAPNSLAAVLCVHSLYTFPEPLVRLSNILQWLRPDGHIIVCDLGRQLNLWDWATYLFRANASRKGVVATVELFWKGRLVARANRDIVRQQCNGTYWTHSTDQLREAISNAGFIVEESFCCYRGYSDFIVARKP